MDRLLQNVDLNEIINNTNMINLPNEQNDIVNKIGTFIDAVNEQDALKCDAKCQSDKKANELYQTYMTANTNAQTAPEEVETAERNYYTYTKGDYAYNLMKEKEFKQKGQKLANALKRDYLNSYKELELLYNNVKQQSTYNKHIDDLANTYDGKHKKLNELIQNTESTANVANRKSYYYNHYTSFMETISLIIYRINIIVAVLFVIIVYLGKKMNVFLYQIMSIVLIANIFIPYKYILRYFLYNL